MNDKKSKISQSRKVYRIGIDARFFGLENKGLGRYTSELVNWLDKLILKDKSQKKLLKIEYYIFLKEENFNQYNPQSSNIYKVKANYQWYSWQEQLLFPFLLMKYNLKLMHFTHFNAPILYRILGIFSGKNKFIVTIHDLILFHYPTIKNTTLNKFSYFFKLIMYHCVIRMVSWQSDLIIAISEFTKQDIIKSLKVSEKKIVVIYEGAEFDESKKHGECHVREVDSENTIFKKYGIIDKYLLYVGNAYPHKNLERLVLAFKELDVKNRNKLQLVLVGKKDYFYKELGKFIEDRNIDNVIITDYISDYDLEKIYKQAKLFVFPSLYEGFGLPPLEALMKGTSVVSSSKSSLKEILGKHVKYFNPEDVKSMRDAIEDGLIDGNNGLKDNEKEKIQSKYSWKKMTKKTNSIYTRLI